MSTKELELLDRQARKINKLKAKNKRLKAQLIEAYSWSNILEDMAIDFRNAGDKWRKKYKKLKSKCEDY